MSRQFSTAAGKQVQTSLPEGDKRIAVVGTTGSGKSVLARTLSQRLSIPHVELDAFYWQSNWTPASEEAFCMAVAAAIDAPNWIVDGNHSAVRDLIWGRANTLIWLDYPLPVLLWRLLRRSVRRILWGEELWNGNRESLRNQVVWRVGRRTLWRLLGRTTAEDGGESFQSDGAEAPNPLLNGHRARHQRYPALLAQPEYAHLRVIRFTSPRSADVWLASVGMDVKPNQRNREAEG